MDRGLKSRTEVDDDDTAWAFVLFVSVAAAVWAAVLVRWHRLPTGRKRQLQGRTIVYDLFPPAKLLNDEGVEHLFASPPL